MRVTAKQGSRFDAQATQKAKSPPAKKERKVIQLEGLKVEGRIQKPEALLVFPRSKFVGAERFADEPNLSEAIVESLKEID